MEEFRDKFIEDAKELLSDLEKDLLLLENNRSNTELVEEIYRVMHTLKGVSAMYGFDSIEEITHELETVYDFIREGKKQVTNPVLNITLRTIDILNALLGENQQGEDFENEYKKLLLDIKTEIEPTTTSPVAEQGTKEIVAAEPENPEQNTNKTFCIAFIPQKNLLRRGIKPLALFEELKELGETLIIPDTSEIPPFGEIDVSKCYTRWAIYLTTQEPEYAVQDVFMFVEDEVQIYTLFSGNLLDDEQFREQIKHIQPFIEKEGNLRLNLRPVSSLIKELVGTEIVFEEEQKKQHEAANKNQQADTAKKATTVFKSQKISSIRVSAEKLDELMNLVSELVTTKAQLSLIVNKEKYKKLEKVVENIDKLTKSFRDNALSLRLVTIESMMLQFQRMVRDLSKELNKEVEFVIEGKDTELDKNIINSLESPLMHIIRNSLDHGIEDASQRTAKGKAEKGIVRFIAFYSGASVFIQIQDDGAGIDHEKIRQKAVEKGIIQPNSKLSEREVYDLIFLPGFSTAQSLTEVSGRGVGMDVVRQKISDLRGEIEIDSEKDLGTSVTIKLPLTLSIIDALLVKVATRYFLIPLSAVDVCSRVSHKELFKTQSQRIEIEGNLIPFIYLREEFGMGQNESAKKEKIVIVKNEEKRIGLVVDQVIGEHQAVLKPLGEVFSNQEFLSGASILGDGNLALVLDSNKLIKEMQDSLVYS